MPLNKDIKKVLMIGSGPIVIGQAAEFDYAGAQACRVLKDAGVNVVLVNSNPATIMTDKALADEIYLEPLTVETIKRIIEKEKPDSMLAGLGGQTGLTLAMQNTQLIALSGLITGIAATLSMASSEFLSSKSEGRPDALKSATYTGVAYLVTVALLILPYLLFDASHYLWALGTMILIVLAILVVFNYYLSVAQDLSFKKRFGQMAGISLGVAALSFVIGILVKQFLGVDI